MDWDSSYNLSDVIEKHLWRQLEDHAKTKKTVFVFGSNLAGRHGKGAARDCIFAAWCDLWSWVGPQGQAYAIPTKDYELNVLHWKI